MNVVATYRFGSVWYAEWTAPLMAAYAQRIGAEFVEFRQFPRQADYGAAPGWFHVEAIKWLAGQQRYEAMLLLDADQVVLPGCTDVFSWLKTGFGVVQDMGNPWGGDRYRSWCERHFQITPPAGPFFNAGMMAITAAAARDIRGLLNGPYPDEWAYDNDYLNLRLTLNRTLDWLPARFNWLAPQFTEAALRQEIVHCVGGWKSLIPDLVRRSWSAAPTGAAGEHPPERLHRPARSGRAATGLPCRSATDNDRSAALRK